MTELRRQEVEFNVLEKVNNLLDSIHILVQAKIRKMIAEAALAEVLLKKQVEKGVN